MKNITWISLLLFILLWFIFSKIWKSDPKDPFIFSDRDKIMVFPTPKTATLDLSPSPTVEIQKPSFEVKSGTDTSSIKF